MDGLSACEDVGQLKSWLERERGICRPVADSHHERNNNIAIGRKSDGVTSRWVDPVEFSCLKRELTCSTGDNLKVSRLATVLSLMDERTHVKVMVMQMEGMRSKLKHVLHDPVRCGVVAIDAVAVELGR